MNRHQSHVKMRACSEYVNMNNPLVSIPGKILQYDDIRNQMERCRSKGCNGMDCCEHLNVIPVNESETIRTCIENDSIDNDCKICCWIMNGLKCVKDPVEAKCLDAGSSESLIKGLIYPPNGNLNGLYSGCNSYEQVFPPLISTYKVTEDIIPMNHVSKQYIAQMVADDVINERTSEFKDSHLVYTTQYPQIIASDIIYSAIDRYMPHWLNNIHDYMRDQVDFSILNRIVHGSNRSQVPATMYCMDSTQTCTLTGSNIASNKTETEPQTPALNIGGNKSFNSIEWMNHTNVDIRDIGNVQTMRLHRQLPPLFSIGSNLMSSADTIQFPRLTNNI